MADEVVRRGGAEFDAAPAEALVARVRGAVSFLVAKPLTFMNLSGGAVGALARYYRIELDDLLVVTDDVNLPLGRLRARPGGSAGGHNGLKSVVEQLGTTGFPGCASASGAETSGGTWPITCSRGSTRTSGRRSKPR